MMAGNRVFESDHCARLVVVKDLATCSPRFELKMELLALLEIGSPLHVLSHLLVDILEFSWPLVNDLGLSPLFLDSFIIFNFLRGNRIVRNYIFG